MPGAVVSIDSFRGQTSLDSDRNLSASLSNAATTGTQRNAPLSLSELYPFSEVQDAMLFQALELLKECSSMFEVVSSIDPQAHYLDFDEELMRIHARFRKLFSLRSIGDGFASVVNAMLWSIRNRDSEPLSRRQIAVFIEALKELRRKPFMHFDTAMGVVDQLEEAGLNVDPNLLDELIDIGE